MSQYKLEWEAVHAKLEAKLGKKFLSSGEIHKMAASCGYNSCRETLYRLPALRSVGTTLGEQGIPSKIVPKKTHFYPHDAVIEVFKALLAQGKIWVPPRCTSIEDVVQSGHGLNEEQPRRYDPLPRHRHGAVRDEYGDWEQRG